MKFLSFYLSQTNESITKQYFAIINLSTFVSTDHLESYKKSNLKYENEKIVLSNLVIKYFVYICSYSSNFTTIDKKSIKIYLTSVITLGPPNRMQSGGGGREF